MNKQSCFSILITIGVFFIACSPPVCKNENPVFEKYTLDSKEYINELGRILQMDDASNISFSFERYEKQEGKEYLFVDISGKKFCAKGKILVTNWNKIEDIRRTKGIGYRGAGLVGLTVNHLQDSTGSILVFKKIDHISD